ncbi:MAG: HAMP domain-containing protein, partial [Spirochaetaceae bacterium]
VGQYRDPDGKSFYAVYSAIPETSGWGLVVVVPRAELMSQVYLIMVLVALSLVALIFSVMTLMHFISRTVVKPISELSNEMKTITRAMDFSRRVQIKRQDEIGQLGQSFNQMGEQLEESFLKIREYSENLEDMVAQRTEELNAANNELKEKNKTIEQEMFIAQRVQRNILPDQATTLLGDELRFAASYSSMEAIGGDLYDISRIGQTTFGFFIADVSGHGIPAALITMLAKVSFTTYSHWDIPTGETCTSVNDAIFRMIGDLDHYLTAYFGKLDLQTGIFEYTNCGHHPAMVIREKDGSIEELDTSGFLIGAFADGMYETKSIQLEEGDRILLFTDGIVEARNEDGDFFGNDRLYDYIKQNLDCVPGDFVDGLIGNVDAYCGSRPADDDRAVLYIQFLSTVDDPDNERKVADALIIEKKSTPGSASVQKKYQKGIDLLQENRLQEALDFFKSRLKKEPENPKLLNYLSATYYAKGDFPEAYRVLETMLELGHDTKAVRKNMEKVRQQLDSII